MILSLFIMLIKNGILDNAFVPTLKGWHEKQQKEKIAMLCKKVLSKDAPSLSDIAECQKLAKEILRG